ncbi:MAG: hypothetical protein IMZ40_00100 [Bacilli bacterium]|nr:hypothetical protein [Bacilli bacterium]
MSSLENDERIELIDEDKMKIFKTTDMSRNLGIAESTVRKYCQELEKAGYQFRRDQTGSRAYRSDDEQALFDLIRLRKQSGISLEMAANVVMTRIDDTGDTRSVKPLSEQVFNVSKERIEKRMLIEFQNQMIKEISHIKEAVESKMIEENQSMKKEISDLKSEMTETNKLLKSLLEKQEEPKIEEKQSIWKKIFK